MGRRGKTESTEENLEIVIGEVESEVIRKLGRAPSMPLLLCGTEREREREGGGEGGALHNTMKPVDHTPRRSLKRITGEGSVSS